MHRNGMQRAVNKSKGNTQENDDLPLPPGTELVREPEAVFRVSYESWQSGL